MVLTSIGSDWEREIDYHGEWLRAKTKEAALLP